MIDGQNFFHGPIENDLRTYDNIQKIVIGQGGYYTTGYLLDYSYFNSYYELQQQISVNNKRLMMIQKQYKKLILQEI